MIQSPIDIIVVYPANGVTIGLQGWYARVVINGNVYSATDKDPWSAIAWMLADYYRREVENEAPWMARPNRLPEIKLTGQQQGRTYEPGKLELLEPRSSSSAKSKRSRATRRART